MNDRNKYSNEGEEDDIKIGINLYTNYHTSAKKRRRMEGIWERGRNKVE